MPRAKPPTKKQRERWERIRELGCSVKDSDCSGYITIQHAKTKMGAAKDHDVIYPLCWQHHLGRLGIDGKVISKREWQIRYGSEDYHLHKTKQLLGD